MSKSRKISLFVLLGLLIGGYLIYNYMYQDHRDIQSEEAKVEVKAADLVTMFSNNDSPDVLNSTVQVSGKITEVTDKSVTIDNSVQCSFDKDINQLKINDQVTVKGRCIGYDELFEIVKLDQSSIIK